MSILANQIDKRYQDLEKSSELFSGYDKRTKHLKKRISVNINQIQLKDKIINYFIIFSELRSLKKINILEYDFTIDQKEIKKYLDDLDNERIKQYFLERILLFKKKLYRLSQNIITVKDLFYYSENAYKNKIPAIKDQIIDYHSLYKKILYLIGKIKNPVTKLTNIERINLTYLLKRKLDFLSPENISKIDQDVNSVNQRLIEKIKINREIFEHSMVRLNELENKIDNFKDSEKDSLNSSQSIEIEQITSDLLKVKSHAFDMDYILNDLTIIENKFDRFSSHINILRSRRSIIQGRGKAMIETLQEANQYIDDSNALPKINKNFYDNLLLNDRSINSASNALVNCKNDLIKYIKST